MTPHRHGPGVHLVRSLAWIAGGLLLLIAIALGGLAWYTGTPDFQRRVGAEVVSTLETATGGRVELGHISFDLWHLAIEADHLVIHGLEPADQAPYLAADKILLRLKLLTLATRSLGANNLPIELSLLRVENPSVHLIIDKDGKTNQPVPKHPATSDKPVIDTLLDLKASDVELVHGVALLNDRAIPFNLAARDLNAQVNYLAKTDRYGATVDLRDLQTQMVKEPEVKSSLHVEAEMGRDIALLKAFDFHSGEHSELKASASLQHFANPEWSANAAGSLELHQIELLTGAEGLEAGSIELNVAGHNCYVAPAVAQQRPPRLIDRLRRRKEAATPTATKTLPPDPDCQKGYLLVGSAKVHDGGYRNEFVRVYHVNAGAQLKITPSELLFSALTGSLPTGGAVKGELKIDNWLGEVPATTGNSNATVVGATATANKTSVAVTGKTAIPVVPGTAGVRTQAIVANTAGAGAPVAGSMAAHAILTVTVERLPLRTILDISAPRNFGDLGFDTAIDGPVVAEWGGPANNIPDSVQVQANLTLAPTGQKRRGALNDLPVSGTIDGHYDGRHEVVNLERVELHSPQTTLTGGGVLGVAAGDPQTALNVDVSARDLGEYDQLLTTLGLTANGRKGRAAIPINLHGTAKFHGTASGAIAKLDVKGHLEATNLDLRTGDFAATPAAEPVAASASPNLIAAAATPGQTAKPAPVPQPATEVHIDTLVANAEYTPQGLAVADSTITQGSAILHLAGSFKPRTVYVHRQPTYLWDNGTAVNVKVQLGNASVVDLLTIAGQQQKIPVTGTIALDANAAGTLAALNGGGTVSLLNGVAYGEPYESVDVAATVTGHQIESSRATVKLHGMTIAGNGGYNLDSQRFHGHVQGDNLRISKFTTVQKMNLNADGVVSLVADANGTVTEPGLKAHVQLTDVVAQGKPVGQATIDAHSQAKTVFYTLRSTLVGAQVAADGQTGLTGDFETQAKLTLAGLDIARPLALFQPGTPVASSDIGGVITVSGPAKNPVALVGNATFSAFSVTAQGITLKTNEPLVIGLHNGLATLDRVHILGPDTDLNASGTAQVFGAINPKTKQPDMTAGKLDIKSSGSISMALAQTFDSDLITSGKVTFGVGLGGIVADPKLSGRVVFQNVNAAVEGIPNGLSNMNGTLVFNEDRLNVQTLTATTGGGQLKLGGFLTYRNGVYADLTATGDNVRVRLYGLSATANASLRLQGGPNSALLSGNVLVTRFGVGADVDFAAFAGAGGVSLPPDPSAPSNKILLDVKVSSSPQLDFQNSYAKLAGTVGLTIRGTVAEPTVLGRIQITDGSATFAGVKYELERGDIYFTNPVRIDPTIDLDATARVESYDVTVGVHGTADSLKPTYRSEPPLSEADIFSLLALGRTQEESQISNEQQVAAGTDPTTNALLSGALNATVSSRVSKLFGGATVKIDPAFIGTLGNSTARITVQQQLSRQLTLTYATNVNSSAEQLIQVQYNLTPNQSIVATRDETGVFSIVYKIRKRYR
jgi:translocation and assembly module TamB